MGKYFMHIQDKNKFKIIFVLYKGYMEKSGQRLLTVT